MKEEKDLNCCIHAQLTEFPLQELLLCLEESGHSFTVVVISIPVQWLSSSITSQRVWVYASVTKREKNYASIKFNINGVVLVWGVPKAGGDHKYQIVSGLWDTHFAWVFGCVYVCGLHVVIMEKTLFLGQVISSWAK